MSREPYEKPEVVEQSVEEMLSEAQAALDKVMTHLAKTDDSLGDLQAVVSTMIEETKELSRELTDAETLVQKLTYVSKVKGGLDGDTGGS